MTLLDTSTIDRLLAGDHDDPHSVLGAQPAPGGRGLVIRAYHPDATGVECLFDRRKPVPMEREKDGLFSCELPKAKFPLRYRLRFHFEGGQTWERGDPYRFEPTLGDMDLHLFNEGTHRRLWEKLGAHPATHDKETGTAFAVWAPNARRVSVVGDWCGWDGRLFPMRRLGSSGVWELFVPGVEPGALYKYEIFTREGVPRIKTDPFATAMEMPPETASVVYRSEHQWGDDVWMAQRPNRDHPREPMLIYEVHLGSWARVPEEGDRFLTYRELAERLVAHCTRLGFTHIELLPVSEHPFYGSWGYQVSGYFAPTARHGSPDDFRLFVDYCHQHRIGVIVDWVPAHFPKDDYALRRFDGTATYEHEDPRQGEHPDWGTLIFNFGRTEVRNFLISNALYWLEELHIDGLRVDAVASMLYLDYSRRQGEWVPNQFGGRENLDAISFLQQLNDTVRAETPGCFTVAEESTSWPGVTHAVRDGGLGFTFKWNMGWMHDTLSYFALDPIHRRHHHDQLTFAMMYEHSERFIMPLSHDEVVHLKGSLLDKMPGDLWQKFANLRVMFTYLYTRPGKALLFMGSEFAPFHEWNHDQSLDWHLAEDPIRRQMLTMFEDLGRIYAEYPALWRGDPEHAGFRWISVNDRENSVLAYERRDGDAHVVVALNLTPVPRDGYRIGAPAATTYTRLLCTDDQKYGGSGYPTDERLTTRAEPLHGYDQSMELRLPPLSAVILAPDTPAGRIER
jgi:1,4-alpha-glucan branching enzyme